jgi:hypothetical protein
LSQWKEIDLRLEHIRELWRELQRTPRNSPTYGVLIEKIRTESASYLSLVDNGPLTADSGVLTAGPGETPAPRPPAKTR